MPAAATAADRLLAALRSRGEVQPVKNGWRAACPACAIPSLFVHDGQQGKGLFACAASCSFARVVAALGLDPTALWDRPLAEKDLGQVLQWSDRWVCEYDYRDADGRVLHQTIRLGCPKGFSQRRPATEADPPAAVRGGYVWSLDGCRTVLYRLPELLAAPPDAVVYVTEGEKGADRLAALGLVATCSPMGAEKWRKTDPVTRHRALVNRRVVVLPNNDEKGRKHAADVRADLAPVAAAVAVLELPGLPDKGDEVDWLDQGRTADDLARLAKRALPRPPVPIDPGISFADLMLLDIPAPEFVVGGLLPTGLTLLAGKPKSGKSWLAYLLAVGVAGGFGVLGGAAARPRPVLYLALEDTRRRLKHRGARLLAGTGWAPPAGLTLAVGVPRASTGGLDYLADWLAAHPGGLVVLDTLGRFRDPLRGRGQSFQEDYDSLAALKQAADADHGAVLVVHHTRKGASDDPFDEVSGTLGINGAADALQILDHERGADAAALYLTGRDLADETLTLGWGDGVWAVTGRADGIERPERGGGGGKPKAVRCGEWLARFLGSHAWPDAEVKAAAHDAGFTPHNLWEAKAVLRKTDPPLASKQATFSGVWWDWMGSKDHRPAERPTPYRPQSTQSLAARDCNGDGANGHAAANGAGPDASLAPLEIEHTGGPAAAFRGAGIPD